MAEKKQELKSHVTFSDGATLGPDDELPAERVKELNESAKASNLDVHPAFLDDSER